MELKKPLSFEDQLKQLESHNIRVANPDNALKLLSKVNYYRFTGYALQFRISSNCSDCRPGTTFETIEKIYEFDSAMRNTLKKYIEVAEVYYRTQIAHHFSMKKCNKAPYDQHYNENNYYNKKGFHEVCSSFEKKRDYYRDSLIIKHHESKYDGKLPLWVIVEMLSMSDLSKLYSSMYISDQQLIATNTQTGPQMLKNHLHCLSLLRNKCAHAARLYNVEYKPSVRFSSNFLRKHKDVSNNTLFAYIIMMLKLLPDDGNKQALCDDVTKLIEKYQEHIDLSLIGFSDNWRDLLKV